MNEKKTERASTISTILYTTESNASRRRAEDDLKVEDPPPERAVAVLAGKTGDGEDAR